MNKALFPKILKNRGFNVHTMDNDDAWLFWGKNTNHYQQVYWSQRKGLYRLSTETVGFTKVKDQKILESHQSKYSHYGSVWNIPKSWYLKYPADREAMIAEANRNPEEIYFWKRDGKHSGKGVFPMRGWEIIRNITQIDESIRDKTFHMVFVQKAVDEMSLIDGSKYDIRTFILIPNLQDPFLVYGYEQHYLRRSLSKYTANSTAKSVHMTNLAVFDKTKKLDDEAVWHWQKFKDYVKEGHMTFDVQTVERNLELTLKDMSYAFKEHFQDDENSKWWFANFAADFMVDKTGNLHFIEFVWLPAMSLKTDMLTALKTEYGEEILNVLFEVAEKKKMGIPLCPNCLETVCDFKLLNAFGAESCTCPDRK